MNPHRIRVFATFALAASATACVPDAGRPDLVARTFLRILAAEDARPSGGADLATLSAATALEDDYLRSVAVRALGRLENPEFVGDIAAMLDDRATSVRVEAAAALAQSVHGQDGTAVLGPLLELANQDEELGVRGVAAQSLGRLQLDSIGQRQVTTALVRLTRWEHEDAPIRMLVGASLGLEAVARRTRGAGLTSAARARLMQLIFYDLVEMQQAPDAGRVRALAVAALGGAGALDAGLIEPALRDPEPRVRSTAARFMGQVSAPARSELIRRGLLDASMHVRIEIVRAIARDERNDVACTRLIAAATRDETQAVRIVALDALSVPCTVGEAQARTLMGAVAGFGSETLVDWQVPAHALVALAAFDPPSARELLPRFTGHPVPFVRAYAARAAALLGDAATLRVLAGDVDANVRTAALGELFRAEGHAVDGLLVAQLSSDDPQLLMTAARLLEESPLGAGSATATGPAVAILDAFERVSTARRETSRDARQALLTRVGELGDASLAPRLEPFLDDFDAAVAAQAATILTRWTGRTRFATPVTLPRLELPTAAELRAMESITVVFHMRGRGAISMQPLPYLATTNAHRFVRLASEGYFDGLTLHRWAANFVIQGGSPGANEYSGDGPFTRDELGLIPHWRGTVGGSTRGRDTGDGQIFINLVDNVRLDHDYTIFAVVTEGMEVVDAVLEGDVIERVDVVSPQGGAS